MAGQVGSALAKLAALVVLAIAAWIVLKIVVNLAAAVAWVVAGILVLIAVAWAITTLRSSHA